MPFLLGIVNRHLFGMESTKMVMPSFCNDATVFHQHATDQWIGTDLPPATFSNQQGVFHERDIVIGPCVVHVTPRPMEFKTSCMGDSCEFDQKTELYAR